MPLAQFGFLHQHIAQPARRHDDGLDLAHRNGVHQRRPVGQLRQLAQETAGTMLDDGLALAETAPPWRTSIAPFSTKARPGRHFARLHDRRAVGESADFAETAAGARYRDRPDAGTSGGGGFR